MNSLVFQTALSSCDCSLTAVCADARLCEQLLPATATLPDHTLPRAFCRGKTPSHEPWTAARWLDWRLARLADRAMSVAP
jgi:hypothetical protein